MSFIKIKKTLINTEHVQSVSIEELGEADNPWGLTFIMTGNGWTSISMDSMDEAEAFLENFKVEANVKIREWMR